MSKIRNLEEFETWVKVQMICQRITQRELADKISAHTPRISEAIHGKASGKKYMLPIIKELGGKPEDFESILKAV